MKAAHHLRLIGASSPISFVWVGDVGHVFHPFHDEIYLGVRKDFFGSPDAKQLMH